MVRTKAGREGTKRQPQPKETFYEVESILSCRETNGRMEYLIKWKGYGDENNDWLQPEDLTPALRKQAEKQFADVATTTETLLHVKDFDLDVSVRKLTESERKARLFQLAHQEQINLSDMSSEGSNIPTAVLEIEDIVPDEIVSDIVRDEIISDTDSQDTIIDEGPIAAEMEAVESEVMSQDTIIDEGPNAVELEAVESEVMSSESSNIPTAALPLPLHLPRTEAPKNRLSARNPVREKKSDTSSVFLELKKQREEANKWAAAAPARSVSKIPKPVTEPPHRRVRRSLVLIPAKAAPHSVTKPEAKGDLKRALPNFGISQKMSFKIPKKSSKGPEENRPDWNSGWKQATGAQKLGIICPRMKEITSYSSDSKAFCENIKLWLQETCVLFMNHELRWLSDNQMMLAKRKEDEMPVAIPTMSVNEGHHASDGCMLWIH